MTRPAGDDLERLYAGVRAELERERGVRAWLRARPTPLRVALVLSVAALVVGAPAWVMGHAPGANATGWLVGAAALVGLVAVTLARSLCGEPPPRAALLALLAAALGAMLVSSDGALGTAGAPTCLALGAMTGLPVLLAGLALDRAPGRHLALAAAGAALTGVAAAQLVCPRRDLAHLLVDHFGALLLLLAIFAGLRRLAVRVEAALRAQRM